MSSRSKVDRDTWEVKPLAFTSVHEIGKAIHPMLTLGQIEGGSAQGLGYALLEEVGDARRPDGQRLDDQLHHADDARYTGDGHRGARESRTRTVRSARRAWARCRIDGPAPAVINALRHAGFDLRAIPATPEKIMAAPHS
jgi:CO/xanthine dehydrogenase Mo-binding subunit